MHLSFPSTYWSCVHYYQKEEEEVVEEHDDWPTPLALAYIEPVWIFSQM